MTIAERHRQQFFRSKLKEEPMNEHFDAGTRQHESASYEGKVHTCSCGFSSPDYNDVLKHLNEVVRKWKERTC